MARAPCRQARKVSGRQRRTPEAICAVQSFLAFRAPKPQDRCRLFEEDVMEQVSHLDGGPEEWLRRIAGNRSFSGVPDHVAAALLAIGFAARKADGSLSATEAGRT